MIKITYKQFTQRANLIYKNIYDYSQSKFENMTVKIKIVCIKHNISFYQMPAGHLKGTGCKKCIVEKSGKPNRNTKESFIIKAHIIHGNKYDYSLSIYNNNKEKIEIICYLHGSFFQSPNSHLSGSGCPTCGILCSNNVKTLQWEQNFFSQAKLKYDKMYDYSKSIYNGCANDILIICPKHGAFFQKPKDHLVSTGCRKCSLENIAKKTRLSQEEFTIKANCMHENKYDYSMSIYIHSLSPITIICPKHGEFTQKAAHHLRGYGCSKCTKIISRGETSWLNYLGLPNNNKHRQIRLKIFNKNYKVDGFDPSTNTIYEFYGDFWHGNPDVFHPEEVNSANQRTFGELYNRTLAKERVLKAAGYNLITIWESVWNKMNKSFLK